MIGIASMASPRTGNENMRVVPKPTSPVRSALSLQPCSFSPGVLGSCENDCPKRSTEPVSGDSSKSTMWLLSAHGSESLNIAHATSSVEFSMPFPSPR